MLIWFVPHRLCSRVLFSFSALLLKLLHISRWILSLGHLAALNIFFFWPHTSVTERMQSELSCALVLVAFMTIGLPEHQGLRENKPCSNNTGESTLKTHTKVTDTWDRKQLQCVRLCVCLHMRLSALNDWLQLWPLWRGKAGRDLKVSFVARQPHRLYSKQG